MKHTQGPWIVQNGLQIWFNGNTSQLSPRICTLQNAAEPVVQLSIEEMKANAQLIAVAPELLGALKELVNAIESGVLKQCLSSKPNQELLLSDLIKLIIKAEGGGVMKTHWTKLNDNSPLRLCSDCHEEVNSIGNYDESWDVCSGCGNIEQSYYNVYETHDGEQVHEKDVDWSDRTAVNNEFKD